MFLGGKSYFCRFGMGLIALSLTSCANRFNDNDPLEEYYSSRPRYQDAGPSHKSNSISTRKRATPAQPAAAEPPTGHVDGVIAEEPSTSTGHGGSAAVEPNPIAPLPVSTTPAVSAQSTGPFSPSGGGRFKNFSSAESALIRKNILGPNKNQQFEQFEPMVSQMMSLTRWPKDVHTVDGHTEEMTKMKFNMNDKFFCEDFTLAETKIPSFYRSNRTLRTRWEGRDGPAAIGEMKRVNQAHNQILRDYKAAVEAGDTARAEQLSIDNESYWKIFSSCLAYSESGIFWKHKDNSKKWVSNWNDYGIYQLNPAQKSGGNLNDCVKNWNQEFPQQKIDEKKFRSDAAFRKAIVTTANQHFNTFCGLSKLHQNLAHQATDNEGCLNPFKKSYNHFGALMQNSDLNLLRCTSKLLPSANGTKTATEALESLRATGEGVHSEASGTH